jgi:hypothetical protein
MVTRWLITMKSHQKRARMSCLQRGADVGWVVVEEGSKLEARSLEAANARADLTEPLVNHLNTLARLFNKPSIVVFCSRSSYTDWNLDSLIES